MRSGRYCQFGRTPTPVFAGNSDAFRSGMGQDDVHDDAGDNRAEGRREKADHHPLERGDGGPHFPEVTFDAIKAAVHFVGEEAAGGQAAALERPSGIVTSRAAW